MCNTILDRLWDTGGIIAVSLDLGDIGENIDVSITGFGKLI